MFDGPFEIIQDRDQLLEQSVVGKANRLFLVALGPFPEILEFGTLPQVEVPVPGRLCAGFFEFAL
jgi:hypothetical protein